MTDRELLLEIAARLERIEAAICRPRQERSLSGADRRRLSGALPAIGGGYGSESFAVRDLSEDGLPGLQVVLAGLSSKAIGQLFLRAEGIPVDGYVIERAEKVAGVVQWRISRVVEPCGTVRGFSDASIMGSEA